MPDSLDKDADVLEVTQHGHHPADVLTTMRGNCSPPDEYTITPGSENGSTNVSLIVPPQRNKFLLPAEKVLAAKSGVEKARHIQISARQHLYTVVNLQHSEANFLRYIITQLGGIAKPTENGLVLRITAPVSTIEKFHSFIRGMKGLSRSLRINPVYESLSVREEIDDLVPGPDCEGRPSNERRVVRVIGDSRGAPDIAVLEQLAEEQGRVRIDSLSRHANPPDTHMFEMVMVLEGDSGFLDKLQPAIVSDNVGIYAADTIPSEQALQYLQAVPADEWEARDIVGHGLQSRYKRWPDRKPVVTGTINANRTPKIRRELGERKIPTKVNVPIVPDSDLNLLKIRPGRKRDSVEGLAGENHDHYRELMRVMLIEILEGGPKIG